VTVDLGVAADDTETTYGPQTTWARNSWTVHDAREIVSRHSTGLDAHKTILGSRHVSPDSGRKLWLYDPMGRIVAVYVDGREQLDELSGSAFPAARLCPNTGTDQCDSGLGCPSC